jgi:hypothetical protein
MGKIAISTAVLATILIVAIAVSGVVSAGVTMLVASPEALVGPQGPQGEQGPAGATGATGPAGPAGATGATGPAGPAGATGATGLAGAAGADGADGADGSVWWNGTGAPDSSLGVDGDFYLNLDNGDVYNRVSGSWTLVANIQGPEGPAGTGSGTAGSVWWNGTGAPDSSLGVDGDFYLNLDNGDVYNRVSGSWTLVANIQGPEGPQGEQGLQGEQGIQGIQGEKGDQGDPGPQGIQGEKGDQGDPGPQGEQGPVGPEGPPGEFSKQQAYFHFVTYEAGVRVASGCVSSSGSVTSNYNVASCSWNSGLGRYEITITGEDYFWTSYATVVTVATSGEGMFATTSSVSGMLLVYIWGPA